MNNHFYTTSDSEANAAIANMNAVLEDRNAFEVFNVGGSYLPMYRLNHPQQQTHFYTSYIDERDAALNEEGYLGEGIAFWTLASPGSTDGMADLYRAYNPTTDDHLYTISKSEIDNAPSYKYEGVACAVYLTKIGGSSLLYRLRSPLGHHFYTASQAERDQLVEQLPGPGYVDEGFTGYVVANDPGGVSPFYRLYSPNTGGHLYTTSIIENDGAIKNSGYRGDGTCGFIYAEGSQPTANVTQLYRCYNATLDDHFYTTDTVAYLTLLETGTYVGEGIAGYVPSSDTGRFAAFKSPVQRLVGDLHQDFLLLPPLPKYLTSNSNFIFNSIIGANTNSIPGLSIEIEITSDISVSSVNKGPLGCTFQLNAYSPDNFTSAWQQYVFRTDGKDILWVINNYSDNSYANDSIIGSGKICTLSRPVMQKGLLLKISLIYDIYDAVLGANFTVSDGNKTLGSKKALVQDLEGGTAFGSAPIIGFQMVLVGYGDGSQTTFAGGGSGLFRISASTPLMAAINAPANAEAASYFTEETANSVYAEVSETKSANVIQGFGTNGTTFGLRVPGQILKSLKTLPVNDL